MSNAQLEKQKNDEWIESVGGLSAATLLIAKELNCGISKAEKIATGRYPSVIPEAERKAVERLKSRKPKKRTG